MAANAVVRARIDEKTKKKATVVLKSMGLTPSAAFRLMMVAYCEGTADAVRSAGAECRDDCGYP